MDHRLSQQGGPRALPHSPAAERNAAPILEVLRAELPTAGEVLEIAAGTGQHAVHFAAALPGLRWQPSDTDAQALAAIRARAQAAACSNLQPPLELDVCAPAWPLERADAVVCINLLHIAPWAATQGLTAGCGRILPAGAPLLVYGPFRVDGRHTADSNARFDAELRARDAGRGIRDIADVADCARAAGLAHVDTQAMPANNRFLVFRRR